jgi:hypothetical protein
MSKCNPHKWFYLLHHHHSLYIYVYDIWIDGMHIYIVSTCDSNICMKLQYSLVINKQTIPFLGTIFFAKDKVTLCFIIIHLMIGFYKVVFCIFIYLLGEKLDRDICMSNKPIFWSIDQRDWNKKFETNYFNVIAFFLFF